MVFYSSLDLVGAKKSVNSGGLCGVKRRLRMTDKGACCSENAYSQTWKAITPLTVLHSKSPNPNPRV